MGKDEADSTDTLEPTIANITDGSGNQKTSGSASTYSHAINIQYIDLSKRTVSKEILANIPENIARKYQIVPIEEKGKKLIVSMVDPEDQAAIELIKKRTGKDLVITICTQDDLNHIYDQYSGIQTEVAELIEDSELKLVKDKDKAKTPKPEETSERAPAAKIVASLFKRAVREKASDIHIEPMEDEVFVRFRIDGVLRKIVSLPKELQPAIVSRIKILSNLKIDEQRLPQDGRFQIYFNQNRIDFRISTLPTVNGEKVVARILDKSSGVLTLQDLGLGGHGYDVLQENVTKSHGMILVTGPTGSGKTTTLYAMLDKLRDISTNIVTLEDPVEYRITGINQCQINPDIGYTFASGLRTILRQDPNIIMVGEIRDFDTANISIHAALTGHIVLSTLHTNNAAGTIPRLIDMDIEPFLLSSSVNVIIGQRLCRKICSECREEVKLTEIIVKPVIDELKLITPASQTQVDFNNIHFYHGKGCPSCGNSGYHGRVGIYEILPITKTIQQLIVQKAQATDIETNAKNEGMITMKQDGLLKCIEGLTTIEEVLRVTKD